MNAVQVVPNVIWNRIDGWYWSMSSTVYETIGTAGSKLQVDLAVGDDLEEPQWYYFSFWSLDI